MRHIILLAAAALAVTACKPKLADQTRVKDAWVRLSPVAGRPAAGYFELKGGTADDKLVRIDSAVVDKIELHQNGISGGMMTMTPIAEVAIPAGGKVEFSPEGNHAMLYGVNAAIKPGTAIPLLFHFASGKSFEAEAKTVAAGADHDMGDMGGMAH